MTRHLFSIILLLPALFLSKIMAVQAGGPPAAMVRVADVKTVVMSPHIWLPATVISRFDARIAAEVDGRIVQLHEVGEQAEKGDVIVRLDDDILRLNLETAKAEIIPVKSQLNYLIRETERLEKLAEMNNAAKNQLDQTRSRRDEVAGQLEVNRARVKLAQTRLEKTRIRAPFSGVVSERYLTEGEWAAEGEDILRLVNIEEREIQARLPVENIAYVKPDDRLTIRVNNIRINAPVRTIVPVGDIRSRLYEIRLTLEDSSLVPGQAAQLAVPNNIPREVTAVPKDALVIRQNTIRVFRINGDTAESVVVETGTTENGLIEIKGEINADDRVVIRGNERLRDGQKITIQ